MKVLIVAAALVSAAALYAEPNAMAAASRGLAGAAVAPAARGDLVPVADEQTPATAEDQKKGDTKSHKGGKKSPSTAAPAAGAAPAAKTPSPPAKGAAAATGAGKKPPGTPAGGPAAAAKKGTGAPPAPAAAATRALPPGVPPGATMIPATGGNPPSYLVPTPNGTQTYIMDPRTGQYSSPSAVAPQGIQ